MEPTEDQVDAAAHVLEVAISSGWKLRPMARAAIRAALAVDADSSAGVGRAGDNMGGSL